jgi:lambda family phage portal protein
MSLSREITIGRRTVSVPVTIVDQVVNWLNPVKGQARYQARARMAISGGYTSADRTRRANQSGSLREMDADSAILPDLRTLREESQHAVRNSPIATGAIKTNLTKVVGTGLKVKSQIDRDLVNLTEEQADAWERTAEREFLLATETREIDLERQLTFSLLQNLVFRKVLEDGDCLVNMPRKKRAGSPYSLKLQVIDAARLSNRNGVMDSARQVAGVVKDEDGAPLTYQVSNRHPGNFRGVSGNQQKMTWLDIPAFSKSSGAPLCLHLFDKTGCSQTRGVPYLAPVLEIIKQLGRYTDAEIMAAVVSGMFTVFVTNETGNPMIGDNPSEATTPTDTSGMEMGHGSVVGLMPGEKIEFANPGRPNTAFDPFVQAILRQIGVALELPYELLVKHFTASYSAARASLEEAWDYFNRRRHWLVTMLCQPVYETVITEAIASGRLAAPGFFSDPLIRRAWLSTSWTGDAPSQLDPMKEINAAEARVNLRISTRAEECARLTGGDWESKLPQMIKENRMMKENDLLPEPVAGVNQANGRPLSGAEGHVPDQDETTETTDQKDTGDANATD